MAQLLIDPFAHLPCLLGGLSQEVAGERGLPSLDSDLLLRRVLLKCGSEVVLGHAACDVIRSHSSLTPLLDCKPTLSSLLRHPH